MQEPDSPKLLSYERRAVEIVLGEEHAEKVFGSGKRSAFTHDDLNEIRDRHEKVDVLAAHDRRDNGITHLSSDKAEWFLDEISNFTPQGFRALDERCKELEKFVKVLQPEVKQLRAENSRLRRVQNADVKITVGEARLSWEPIYKNWPKNRHHNGRPVGT